MLCCTDQQIATDILEECVASTVRVQQPKKSVTALLELLDSEYKGSMLLQNVCNYFPGNMA